MPEFRCRRIPQSFIAGPEITRDLTPQEFLHCYYGLRHIIATVESDIQTLMYFRGWCAHGASSGPDCRMRKTFPNGAVVEATDKFAPEIEAMFCWRLGAQTPPAPPPPPTPNTDH